MRFRVGVILFFTIATAAGAQEGGPRPAEGRRDLSFAVGAISVFQFPSKLEGGSEFRANRYAFPIDLLKRIDGTRDLGLSLFYDCEDYDFQGPAAFAGAVPWTTVHRIGVGVPYAHRLEGGWRLSFTPSAEFSRESGAEWGSALQYGGIVSAGKRVGDTLTLGVGAGVFYRLEEVSFFPYLAVEWRITERLRLSNPLRAGPTGPAGLELVCSLSRGWETGFGGAYRSIRFRLDDEGVAPGGIGEVRAVPAWFRLSYRRGSFLADAYAGAVLGGKLGVENAQGDGLGSGTYDPAPFAALRLQARF